MLEHVLAFLFVEISVLDPLNAAPLFKISLPVFDRNTFCLEPLEGIASSPVEFIGNRIKEKVGVIQ